MQPKPEPVHDRPTPDPHKTAIVAGFVSFLFPGLGHLLIGARLRGAIWLLGWLIVSAAGGGVAVLALMMISGLDGYAYASMATPTSKKDPT